MHRLLGFASFVGALACAGSVFAEGGAPLAAQLASGSRLVSEPVAESSAGTASCTAPAWSSSAIYVGGNAVSYGGSQYVAAYWNQNDEPDTNSGPAGSGQPWQSPVACNAPSCSPNCAGMECGTDGCGGSCGTCGAAETCSASNQCVSACTPVCGGKQCGGDGCGGSCGTCGAAETCSASDQCVSACTPVCGGKQCGGDGCGGTCGSCASGATCDSDGVCQAPPTQPNAATPPLAVSLDPQLQSEWCWAASAEMIMSYLGTSVQQCDEANYRFGRTDCCSDDVSAENIYECNQPGWPNWAYWGFSFDETPVGSALTFAQLQAEIAANRPVGFAWAWTTGGGHYMVATGTETDADNTQYVTINDPWAPNVGEQVTLTYEDWVSGPAGTDPTATASYTHMADDYAIARN